MSHNMSLEHLARIQGDDPKIWLLSNPKALEIKSTSEKRCCSWIPARFVLTFWTFCGLSIVYALRANLSVAIVAMVKSHPELKNGTNISSSCPRTENLTALNDLNQDGEFDWDDKTQGTILGAFFYGYIITQLPGGILAERFGGKWLLGVGTLITAVATLFTPLAARCHLSLLIIARIIAGIGEGVTFPSFYTLFSHWVPSQERSIIIAITNSGSFVGIIVAMPATAWLCEHGFSGGWPSVFYIFGAVGCAWFCFWALLISENPENHPCITKTELKYIMENRGSDKKVLHFRDIPWKFILTSWPVWALALTKVGNSWAFYTVMTELPNFMKQVLNYAIEANGAVNSLVYVSVTISVIATGALSDILRAQAWFSATAIRKVFQCFASFVPAIGLSLVPFMGCNSTGVVSLLFTSMAFHGFNAGGESPSSLDLSSEYVGIIYGLTNCLANVPGFLAPLATGYIISGDDGYEKWQYVFYLAALVNIIGGLVFLVFGSASPQPWPLPYQEIPMSSKHTESDNNCDYVSDSKSVQA